MVDFILNIKISLAHSGNVLGHYHTLGILRQLTTRFVTLEGRFPPCYLGMIPLERLLLREQSGKVYTVVTELLPW